MMAGERVYTVALCLDCMEPVRPSRHTPAECTRNLRRQRDEALATLRDIQADGYCVYEEIAQRLDALLKGRGEG